MERSASSSGGGGGLLVAGSHTRKELIVISCHAHSAHQQQAGKDLGGRTCEICGEEMEMEKDVGGRVSGSGEAFVGCNECGFPICRTCYDYERLHGTQLCPLCKTRFPRLKECPRVEGDEEEDDVDDLDNEFNLDSATTKKDNIINYDHTLNAQLANNAQLQLQLVEVHNNDPQKHDAYPVPSGKSAGGRSMDPSKDPNAYGFGNQLHDFNGSIENENDDLPPMDEARLALSRKFAISSSQLNPYRVIIIIRLLVLAFFFHYRLTHPVKDAYALWITSITCELWFALSWILDQFPKWHPVERETYLNRLSLRYEKEGRASQLCAVDVFVRTVDPTKEPPIRTANTVLSILAVDYPVEKVSCYVSDDGAAMLTFEALSETSEFANKWVPFCKKFNIEPRAPEWYFAHKVDYLNDKDKVLLPSFVKERRAIKREYEEFKVRINALVAKAKRVPEQGWTMQDGTPWPGDNVRDHPGMIQVLLGQGGGRDINGNGLPRLVYVSREKRPGFNHHKKAGAMNALVRVSAVLTNAPYILNLDCDHYINNSKALREAMCFMMDTLSGKRVCYVQFPQRFDSIDENDRYANRNTVFFDINMKGLDGIQGPIYVGTGCVFRRQALYGIDAPKTDKSPTKTCNCWPKWCCCFGNREKKKTKKPRIDIKQTNSWKEDALRLGSEEGIKDDEQNLEKKFGQSSVFVASTLLEDGGTVKSTSVAFLLKEAIHVVSCGYETKTEWGKEVGWIYGSVTEDILTGFKMHCRGWRSIYCVPTRPAFKGSAPINLSDRLHQVLRWALGSVEMFLSRHCPLWYGYGGGLKWLERVSYINATLYPWTSIPLLAYSTLPAVCLFTGKFIIPELSNTGSLWFVSLFMCIFATSVLEMRWSGVGIDEWWRNQQFWVIGGVSAHLFAVFQGLFKVIAGVDTNFTVTSKSGSSDDQHLSELYAFKWTTLLIPPTTLLVLNVIAIVTGISKAINKAYESWGPLFGKLLFACWVLFHLYPFIKGLLGRQNRTPTIVVVWSILLASIFSLSWVRIDQFSAKSDDPFLEECGLDCPTT